MGARPSSTPPAPPQAGSPSLSASPPLLSPPHPLTMPKSTPSRAKATPSKAAASPAAASTPASASKKRVRVVDNDAATAAATPAKKPKGKAAAAAAPTEAEVGGNGVERKDLRDKVPGEVEAIRSRDAPAPQKGALKKGAAPANAAGAAKGKGKKVEADEEIKFDEGDDDDDEDEGDEEEIDFLAGFESGEDDGEDSSDEEMDDEDAAAASKGAANKVVEQLPKVKGAQVQKKLDAKEKKQHKTGTVYLGRIPKGFYEDEMRSYFSQFGEVTRLRLSRNKKTGASKHYAFIEFKYASVAQIVHETMDNYLLAGHILVCKVVPEDEIHPKLWVGANRKFRPVPKARQDAARRTKPKTDKQQDAIRQRLLKQEDKKRKQLADLGIEYDFGGYAGKEVAGDEKDEDKKAKKDKAAPAEAGAEETPRRRSARKSAGGAAATPTQSATKKKAAPRKSK
ncbi:hypothetical protein DMC30DRAFT_201967 [Rhodotorula diobovata]|uniref:RRM domain-containing protein n=1 Tax=Rhodotorula diobovata TaxID=5288 RepID=A0A5C5FXM5_9BASI|nr:hypothetical protein DMC30DRAFT_201967 [Rhodotorula diobovata]